MPVERWKSESLSRALTSGEIFTAAVEGAYNAILITTAELEAPGPFVVYVNRAFERMTGYSRDELIGKSPRLLQGPDTDREMLRALRVALDNNESFSGKNVNYRKDGGTYVVEWHISKLQPTADGPAYYISVQKDVTQEENLRREQERLIQELRDALKNVRTLSGLIPICAACKKVRSDEGYWKQIEEYISQHSEAEFSHSLCPTCLEEYFVKLNRR